jgi:lipoate-protein ligase A
MALDEAIALAVRRHHAPPTLRFYGWDRPSLSLGCFQTPAGLGFAYCNTHHIPMVRRPTGGRAILHGEELTYSFSARTDQPPFASGLLDSYRSISSAFCLAFKKIGIPAASKMTKEKGRVLTRSPLCFASSSYGEILIDHRKLVGAAQKRWKDGLLQQGSIPYAYDEEKMRHVFAVKGSLPEDGFRTALRDVMPDFAEMRLKEAIVTAFAETFGISLRASPPSPEESRQADDLEARKYLQESWNLHRWRLSLPR